MSIRMSKERAFQQVARKYWEKFFNGFLVPGERGYVPSEGEMLGVYNELKERHPECECFILRTGKRSGEFYQQGDKIAGIRIVRQLDSIGSIEFRMSIDFYMRLEIEGLSPFFRTEVNCDLAQTISNFEEFIDRFPSYMEGFEKKKIEETHAALIKAKDEEIAYYNYRYNPERGRYGEKQHPDDRFATPSANGIPLGPGRTGQGLFAQDWRARNLD